MFKLFYVKAKLLLSTSAKDTVMFTSFFMYKVYPFLVVSYLYSYLVVNYMCIQKLCTNSGLFLNLWMKWKLYPLILEKVCHATQIYQYILSRILLKKYLRLDILLDYSVICSVTECLPCMPHTKDSTKNKTSSFPAPCVLEGEEMCYMSKAYIVC